MISHELWLRLFHEQPLEKHLTLGVGRGNYEVVGVMPRGMHFPACDVWLPPGKLVGDSLDRSPSGRTPSLGRDPASPERRCDRDMNVVFAGLNAAVAPRSPVARPLFTGVRTGIGRSCCMRCRAALRCSPLVATVLLIACANLGTMLLARGMARRREIAIRIALGATRRAIATQVLTECAIIVGVGRRDLACCSPCGPCTSCRTTRRHTPGASATWIRRRVGACSLSRFVIAGVTLTLAARCRRCAPRATTRRSRSRKARDRPAAFATATIRSSSSRSRFRPRCS